MEEKKSFNRILFFRRLFLAFSDVLATVAACFLAVFIRFEFSFEKMEMQWLERIYKMLPINIAIVLIVFILFGLYKSVWAYVSYHEFVRGIVACFIADVVLYAVMKLSGNYMPRSFWFLYLLLLAIFVIGIRFSYRALRVVTNKVRRAKKQSEAPRVMLVGAGEAGNMLIREMKTSRMMNCDVVCVIDDNSSIIGSKIYGVKIVGDTSSIEYNVDKYAIERIVIAMPSVSKKRISEIAEICSRTSCEVKIIPGIYDLVDGKVLVSQLRDVDIEDVLGRDPIKLDTSKILNSLQGQTVLVTGGGGSIGSELCRQIAANNPKQLIIVDIYENNAYDIQQELKRKYADLNLEVLIASVRNEKRIDRIFDIYRPDIVFHAAAHKHVPLMEESPNEAIKNNVFGTLNVAKAADKYGVKSFVLISTDKAVNPTNVMGASKRICEMIVQSLAESSRTSFVAVRFGNVLGSNGSVIPLFKKQIKEGGPVTVTDPNIIRYFMTIPEAVSLVLEAGSYASGGEIYVLDMGAPVRIDDLARNLINLSGYVPDEDIKIEYTGLRPGEKLYEERLMDEEGLEKTQNDLISVAKPIKIDTNDLFSKLDELYVAVYEETDDVRRLIGEIVTTYKAN